LLLLGHLDTVWPLGTLQKMPFRVRQGRAWGPGVLDMKAGVVMALGALRMLLDAGQLTRPVWFLLNSDEETGSQCSRALTESLARKCEAVFVLEPAQGIPGAYKTARKGVANYHLQVHGVAAHSGVDFDRGHSAVLELGRQIERASAFTDLARGITVNAGVIGGGTRSNVVAAEAWAEFDVRIARAVDAKRMDRLFHSLRAVDRKCRLEISGGLNRPPMERTSGTVALFRRAATMAAGLGFSLQEAATGGGSDGNFTSALGIPTLDGMGAVGEGAHASHESILLDALVPRTALLAAMIGGLSLQ
jgi:glutamate carboxypeptidase